MAMKCWMLLRYFGMDRMKNEKSLPLATESIAKIRTETIQSAGSRFRVLLDEEQPLQIVGTVNAYCALLAEQAGFRAIYLSGAGVANACFGLPDLGMTTLNDVVEEVRRITKASSLPLLVDADTGWGNALNIARTVEQLTKAGAAGMHLEDQAQAKRCGHRPNKVLVSTQVMTERIQAAVDAKTDQHFVIMARTDAASELGLNTAIERASSYVEAGADMIFAESLTTLADYQKFAQAVSVPVLANITEFGLTPLFSLNQLGDVGISIVLYPLSAFRAMNQAAMAVYQCIRQDGTQQAMLERMQSREQLYELLDYHVYETRLDEALAINEPALIANHKMPGLRGHTVGQTALSEVGDGAGLSYCGYNITELAERATFEEVAYLLAHGELPNIKQLHEYTDRLISLRTLPKILKKTLEQIPISTVPMDVLRTGCSMLGTLEPEQSFKDQFHIAERLLALLPAMMCYWYRYSHDGVRIETQTDDTSIAGYILHRLNDQAPDELTQRAMDVSMILYAEHEFNASTFSARVCASTQSDFYSAVCAAIGTLRGPLHGGANEAAMMLMNSYQTPEQAIIGIMEKLQHKEKIMGFGHAVYKVSDPRNAIIKKWSKKLSERAEDKHLYAISVAIEKLMWQEKKLCANLDFFSASAYHFLGIPRCLFTPVFVCSRLAGWTGHIFEQRKNNSLIRPSAEYIGSAPRHYKAIEQRH